MLTAELKDGLLQDCQLSPKFFLFKISMFLKSTEHRDFFMQKRDAIDSTLKGGALLPLIDIFHQSRLLPV